MCSSRSPAKLAKALINVASQLSAKRGVTIGCTKWFCSIYS